MGVEPKIWGPYFWTALHLMCEGAPAILTNDAKEHYRAFFAHMAHVLPCAKCADHLQQVLARHPIGNEVMTREHLIEWCIELHNEVTADVSPSTPRMQVKDAKRHWEAVARGDKPAFSAAVACGDTSDVSSASTHRWLMVIVILALVGGGAYVILRKNNKK